MTNDNSNNTTIINGVEVYKSPACVNYTFITDARSEESIILDNTTNMLCLLAKRSLQY